MLDIILTLQDPPKSQINGLKRIDSTEILQRAGPTMSSNLVCLSTLAEARLNLVTLHTGFVVDLETLGKDFFTEYFSSRCQYHSTHATYSSSQLSSNLHNPSN